MIVSRILPGEDLKTGLKDLIATNDLKYGIIICIVGSLNQTVLRMSNGDKKIFKGIHEIVSAEGTISSDGIHVHIAISDASGTVYGGHLLEGCKVHTTAEIGILKSEMIIKRIKDPKTGYKELFVQK
ncbi:MAG: PPC domain-containing DNA-binding protein [Methanobacterium sp.]